MGEREWRKTYLDTVFRLPANEIMSTLPFFLRENSISSMFGLENFLKRNKNRGANELPSGPKRTGNGSGEFEPVPLMESGFFAPHDAKDMKMIEVNGQKVVLVAYNQHFLQAIEVLNQSNDQLVSLK